MKNESVEIYMYETVDGCIGASINIPEEADVGLAILTVRNITKEQAKQILEDADMSLVNSVLENVRKKYL